MTCVSLGKGAVVSMGAIAAACPILERNGPFIPAQTTGSLPSIDTINQQICLI